jgi:GT2 family glycosyltransferase
VASNNLALSAAAFRTLGGFDTSFPRAAGEDRELCDRWIASGRRIRYVPDAIVDHAHAMDLRKFLRQHYGYGTGAVAFHAARAARGNGRIEVEHPSFYLRLLSYPLRTRGVRRPITACALLATSQVANALGFASETWRWRRRGRPADGGDRPSGPDRDATIERIESMP